MTQDIAEHVQCEPAGQTPDRADMAQRPRPDRSFEARVMGALLAFVLAVNLITAALWIIEGRGMMVKVAMLTGYASELPWVLLTLGAAIGGFGLVRAFGLWPKRRILINKIGGRVIGSAAVLWFYLAITSRNMDVKYTTGTLLLNSSVCVATWLIMASSKNTGQIEAEDRTAARATKAAAVAATAATAAAAAAAVAATAAAAAVAAVAAVAKKFKGSRHG